MAAALKSLQRDIKGLHRGRTGQSPKKAYIEAERVEALKSLQRGRAGQLPKKPTARPNGPKP